MRYFDDCTGTWQYRVLQIVGSVNHTQGTGQCVQAFCKH